jgi:glycosyltransferase involved in cell wall biosynthesis
MKSEFRVSVLVTSYNQKVYLVEALESVIRQTVKPHEIIVADDYSTDGESIACIEEYMARYPGWVKGVFQAKNVGIPQNRNAALREATGDYVAILDGDDRFLPHKIEQERAALLREPAARCVYGNVRYIDAAGRPLGLRDAGVQPSGKIFSHVARARFGLLRSMLIDYRVLREVGLMDEAFPKYDGFDLTVRLAKRCGFVYVPEPLTEYRVYPTSDSKGLSPKDHLRDLQGIFKKVEPLLTDLPPKERSEITALWLQQLFNLLRDYVSPYLPAAEEGDFSRFWSFVTESREHEVWRLREESRKLGCGHHSVQDSRRWSAPSFLIKAALKWKQWKLNGTGEDSSP